MSNRSQCAGRGSRGICVPFLLGGSLVSSLVFVAVDAPAAPWTAQKVVASDGAAGDRLGVAVVVSGTTAAFGAPAKTTNGRPSTGEVYAYVKTGASWVEQQKLVDPDQEVGDYFGASLGLSSDTLVVGEPKTGNNGLFGVAVVYVRSGTTWSVQDRLTASSNASPGSFASAVAISGDTILVTGVTDDGSQGVHVFVRSSGTWSEQQVLTLSDNGTDGSFGNALSISGNTAVIGRYLETRGANNQIGSAYVFVRSGTTWSQQQKLVASDGARLDIFGTSVSISGDSLVVGAPEAQANRGSAYVFVRSGTTWSEQKKLTASDGVAGDFFGNGVSISGDTAVVGAALRPLGGKNAAYVYTRTGTVWSEQQKLVATDPASGDSFGNSVSISGNAAAVGAPLKNSEQGAAYVFTGPPLGIGGIGGMGGNSGTGGAGGKGGTGGTADSGTDGAPHDAGSDISAGGASIADAASDGAAEAGSGGARPGTGGSAGAAGTGARGGVQGTGGSGAGNTGGAARDASTGVDGSTTPAPSNGSGCDCSLGEGSAAPHGHGALAAVTGLLLVLRRRRLRVPG